MIHFSIICLLFVLQLQFSDAFILLISKVKFKLHYQASCEKPNINLNPKNVCIRIRSFQIGKSNFHCLMNTWTCLIFWIHPPFQINWLHRPQVVNISIRLNMSSFQLAFSGAAFQYINVYCMSGMKNLDLRRPAITLGCVKVDNFTPST